MEKKRLEKYESLIQSIINQYFIVEGKGLIKNNFLTIMGVKASSNMSLIKIYLSFLKENSENENFKIVQQNSKKIRGYLGNKIRHLIRKIPEIKFILDKSEHKASNIEKILAGLDIPKDNKK
tara:strand:- start:428 stop:793 length:366 start_codon:yes stop_codon:yes gene_type:complete